MSRFFLFFTQVCRGGNGLRRWKKENLLELETTDDDNGIVDLLFPSFFNSFFHPSMRGQQRIDGGNGRKYRRHERDIWRLFLLFFFFSSEKKKKRN